MNMLKILFVMAILLTFAACGGNNDANVIRIGLTIDESNPVRGEAASRALAQAMEDFLGVPVEPVTDIGYIVGTEAMRAGHLDVLLVSAFNYVHTSSVVDVEIVATVPTRAWSINNSVFIVCASNEEIFTLEDLRGKTMAFVSATSTSGFAFPAYYLLTALGLNPDLIAHDRYFFDTVTFTGGHEANIMGVAMGDFDAAAVGGIFIENMYERGLIDPADFRIIAATQAVPYPSYIVRSELGQELVNNIREFFMQFDSPEYFTENWGGGNSRFLPPDIEGFAYFRSVVETLGLVD
ncbi:MAG: phosphate/phosphite/phosphonate ABC transporter substrate-binding protein [Defluviitaleaceae bacterium]|nr:phosphate/phosphite/phosphonate ABC transporter substrate-binding protein [Defluviitaleaceae bacterium]